MDILSYSGHFYAKTHSVFPFYFPRNIFKRKTNYLLSKSSHNFNYSIRTIFTAKGDRHGLFWQVSACFQPKGFVFFLSPQISFLS